MSDKQGILHIRAERKAKYGQALRIEEIRQIVKVLNNKKTKMSIDTKGKALIFWFEDEKDKTKVNKIVVDLNYKIKKFGVSNYMTTIGKTTKENLNQDGFIKIR